jgi:hypothetical protein
MKFRNIALFCALLFSYYSYAEGQRGLGIFITFIYVISIFFYTILGTIFIKIIFGMLNIFKKNQTRTAFFFALIISILTALLFEESVLFIF